MIKFETTPTECPIKDEYYGYEIDKGHHMIYIFKVVDIDLFNGIILYQYWPNHIQRLSDKSNSSYSSAHSSGFPTLKLYKVLSGE